MTVLHRIVLALWLAAIMTAGMTAAVIFPTLKNKLDVHLPEFDGFDRNEHWSIAAGTVMDVLFWITDLMQFVLAPIALVLSLLALRGGRSRLALASIVAVALACLALAARAVWLAPRMNRELKAFWAAARDGQAELAMTHREAFAAMHPTATTFMMVTLVLVLIAIALPAPHRRAPAPALEVPDLAKRS